MNANQIAVTMGSGHRGSWTVSPSVRLASKILLVVAGYYVAGLLGLQLGLPPLRVSSTNAILLAVLLLASARRWWLFVLAVFPAHMHVVTHFGPAELPPATMFGQFGVSAFQAVLGALMVRPLIGIPPRLDTLRSMTAFVSLAAIAAPAISSLPATALLMQAGWTDDFWLTWRIRFLSNAFMILTLTPLIVLSATEEKAMWRSRPLHRYGELGLLMAGVFGVGILVFGIKNPGPGTYPALLYAPLPLLLWAATRYGLRSLSASLLVIAILSVTNTSAGRGPFAPSALFENVTQFQLYLLAISLPLIFLTTVFQERRRAVEALGRSEEEARTQLAQLSAIYGASPIGLAFVGKDLRFVSINDHLAEIDRLPAEAHVGRTLREVLGNLADQIEPLYRRVLETGQPIVDFEINTRGAVEKGPWAGRVWQVTYQPVKNDSGAVLGVSAVVQEITARKRQEEVLRNIAEGVSARTGETFFRSLAEHISSALQVEYTFVCELVDGSQARTIASYVNGAEMKNFEYDLADTPCEQVLRHGMYTCPRGIKAAFSRDLLLQDMDVEGYLGVCLKDSTGCPLGLMAVMSREPMVNVEATLAMLSIFAARASAELKRKQAEEALRISEERYREVVDSQTDLVCRFLGDSTLTFVNEAYCRFFGCPREKLIGRKFLEFLPAAAREAALNSIVSLSKDRRVQSVEHEVILPDGSIGWQHWVDYAIIGPNGEITEFQAIGRDITDRKRAEEASLKLAHASRLAMVGELAAIVAHELSQPLSAMLNNAEAGELMLLKAKPPPVNELREILTDIRHDNLRAADSIRRMRALLRQQQLELEPLDLADVLADALHMVSGEAARRRVQIQTDCPPELPLVRGDRVHLQQVLLNLILNGMDAMDATLECDRRLRIRIGKNGDGTLEVALSDAGQGIPLDRLPRIFESFYTTKKEGMGLGLSIAKSIIEAHLGRIWAENNPKGGATFLFTLPIDEATPEA